MNSPTASMSKHKHRDTATALEALLEIKHSPSFPSANDNTTYGSLAVDEGGVAQEDGSSTNKNNDILRKLQMPATNTTRNETYQANKYPSPSQLLSPRQVPVPAGLTSPQRIQIPYGGASARHHYQQQQQQQQQHLFAASMSNRQRQQHQQSIHASTAAAAVAAAAHSHAQAMALGTVPPQPMSHQMYPVTSNVLAMTSTSAASSDVTAAEPNKIAVTSSTTIKTEDAATAAAAGAAAAMVREEEIKAALASKPQRGRKRDNLTAMERKELTRTRNREHARSTRMRKKARNDELLAIEKKYLEMKKKEELAEGRRSCVKDFIAIRTHMIQSALSNTLGNKAAEEVAKKIPSLKDVVENEWLFDIAILGTKGDAEQGVIALRKMDERIVDYIKSHHGNATSSTIKYQVAEDCMAITDDAAFAVAELVDQRTGDTILSLSIQFKFASGMSKIRSLAWSSPSNPELFHTKPTNGSGALNKHIVLPTVVSMHSVASLDCASSADSNEDVLSRKVSFPEH